MIHEHAAPPSPHHRARTQPITAIVIHDTASHTAQSALSWFANPASGVSAHVVIDRDGTIYRVVPDDRVAWHAGKSTLHAQPHVNAFSLGVELVDADDGVNDPYPDAQLTAAAEWCGVACARYRIPLNRIVGHRDIAPGRKVDPGSDFAWSDFLLRVAWHQLG